jgi:hypothetical protein
MRLHFFKPVEFRSWWGKVSPELLFRMDCLRGVLGRVVSISKASGSIGRLEGDSQHNLNLCGEVRALDFFVAGLTSVSDVQHVVNAMLLCGFTGVGVYTDTRNNDGERAVMFHGDVRPDRGVNNPSTWGRVNGEYVTLERAIRDSERLFN